MGLLKNAFTWWEGAGWSTSLFTRRMGNRVGVDELGNVYFESKKPVSGQVRRWVIYQGPNDASRVPPAWFGWLHHQTDIVPDDLPTPKPWVREPLPNLTGTGEAYRPQGALERGGVRAAATGDYEAWSPN
jgi:NADH:ubiquinone oxidoreductase subunit